MPGDEPSDSSWRTFWVRPPARDAPRHVKLTFIRHMQARLLLVSVPLGVAVLWMNGPSWLLMVVGGSFGLSVLDVGFMTYMAARARRTMELDPLP